LGSQWGDEGKGKIVDVLGCQADLVARFNGGANAGHTIVVGSKKYAFHLIPSAVLHPKCECLLGNGCVINLDSMLEEMALLDRDGIDYKGRFFISDRAQLLFRLHKIIDGLRETKAKETGKNLGTTRQGIGPCYTTKAERVGVRVADFMDFENTFVPRYKALFEVVSHQFGAENFASYDIEAEISAYRKLSDSIKPMIVDGVLYMHKAIQANKKILVEGANATMLDLDFGTYPYVTSSTTSAGGAATGLGIPPHLLKNSVAIVKAYTTRVGEGPFLSEDLGKDGQDLQRIGQEFGVTTGRIRRCGWIDIVQLKYSNYINGFTQLHISKLDVLDQFPEIKVVTGYTYNGQPLESYPSSLSVLEKCKAVVEVLPGWNQSIAACRNYSDLPANARHYIELIEKLVGVSVTSIGVGPKRDDMVFKKV